MWRYSLTKTNFFLEVERETSCCLGNWFQGHSFPSATRVTPRHGKSTQTILFPWDGTTLVVYGVKGCLWSVCSTTTSVPKRLLRKAVDRELRSTSFWIPPSVPICWNIIPDPRSTSLDWPKSIQTWFSTGRVFEWHGWRWIPELADCCVIDGWFDRVSYHRREK